MTPNGRRFSLVVTLWLAIAIQANVALAADVLSQKQKNHLVECVGKRLANKAFAFDTDFSKWKTYAAEHSAEIQEAGTKEELAKALGDALETFNLSHLGIFAPSTVKRRRAGQRTGIGITIHPLEEGGAFISYVLSNSPAERCGLQKGDILTAIDDEPLVDIKQLAGELGQKRQLHWKRNETSLSCEIEYAAFSLSESSSISWPREDVAIIRIQSFLPKFYKAARINKFFKQARDAKGIIIDLRNNRGGLSFYSKHLASKIASPKKTFAYLADKRNDRPGKQRREIHPLPLSKAYQGKIVILVDSLSASAADIVPAFVSENKLGTVIGQRTSGALQLAKSFPLPYGFRVYLPIAEMLTPKEKRLEGIGFEPDIELSLEETIDDATILAAALKTIDES